MIERILNEIKYDHVTGTINVDNVRIFVNIDADSSEPGSYAISKTGSMYSITITGKTIAKSFPCAMYEVYRNIGYIFADKADVTSERGFYYKSDYVSDNPDHLLKEMWVDRFAMEKREYGVCVEKVIELVHKEDIVKVMPDADKDVVNERIKEVNSEIKFRRTYLNFLKDMYLEKNPKVAKIADKNKKKISPMEKRRLKEGLEEAAMAMGFIQEKRMPDLSQNTLSQTMSKMRLAGVPNKILFEDGMKMIIHAIDREHVHPGLFNLQTHQYMCLNHEPDNWEKKFGKYYFKSGSVYVLYAKTSDGKVPGYMEGNTYERITINREKSALSIIDKYERVVNDFLKPVLKRYQHEIYMDKREAIGRACIQMLNGYVYGDNKSVPTMNDLDETIREIKVDDSGIATLKQKMSGMMSYNERKKAFINDVKREIDESDDAFKLRAEALWQEAQYQRQ